MVTVFSSSFSISISTSSPTDTGLVEVIASSILNMPFMRALYTCPSIVLVTYQLPVDLYTKALIGQQNYGVSCSGNFFMPASNESSNAIQKSKGANNVVNKYGFVCFLLWVKLLWEFFKDCKA